MYCSREDTGASAGQPKADSLSTRYDCVDAATHDVTEWYIQRFLRLRASSFSDPDSYFHRYADLSDDEAIATAQDIWARINGRNLAENVLPTRERATLVLRKGANHVIERVLVRKI